MNELTKVFEGNQVRVIDLDGVPWFVAKDVALAIGYRHTIDAVQSHCKGTPKFCPLCTSGGTQTLRIINESDLYLLVAASKLPSLKKRALIESFQEEGYLLEVVLSARKEIEFLHILEGVLDAMGVYGVQQYECEGFRIDFYIPSLNVAIEYDENGHKYYDAETQEARQHIIVEAIGCTFIRVTDEDSDLWNVGYVIKNLIHGGKLITEYEDLMQHGGSSADWERIQNGEPLC